jgi:hypothetical protein
MDSVFEFRLRYLFNIVMSYGNICFNIKAIGMSNLNITQHIFKIVYALRYNHFVFQAHVVARLRSWFRHCATSRKVAGSIPDYVIRIFQ